MLIVIIFYTYPMGRIIRIRKYAKTEEINIEWNILTLVYYYYLTLLWQNCTE